jgi:hypothetical protein
MVNVTYNKQLTALVVIDPYNDFLSEGGKIWDRIRAVAEANECIPHMLQVLNAARKAELRLDPPSDSKSSTPGGYVTRVGNVWSSRFMRHFAKRQRTDSETGELCRNLPGGRGHLRLFGERGASNAAAPTFGQEDGSSLSQPRSSTPFKKEGCAKAFCCMVLAQAFLRLPHRSTSGW